MEFQHLDPVLFKRWLKEAVRLPLIAALLIILLSLWRIQSLSESMKLVDHSDRVIAHADLVERLVIDAQNGLRGFNLSHDSEIAENYNEALIRLPGELGKLKKLVDDNPEQLARLNKIETDWQSWADLSKIVFGLSQKHLDYHKVVPRKQGKHLIDAVRVSFDQFISAEQELRHQYRYDAQQSIHIAVISGVFVTLLLGIFLSFRSRGRLLALSGTYNHLLTDLQIRAEELFESREWFSTTLRSIGDGVIVVDAQSRLEFLNSVAEQLTGYKLEQVRGKPMADVFNIIHQETRKRAFNPVDRVLSEGVIVGLANHTTLIARDGNEYPIEDSAAPICDKNGKILGVILVFRDVTAKYKTERELVKLNHELQNAVNVRDAFLSIASHELKTPLTSLKLQLQLAARALKPELKLSPTPERMLQMLALCLTQTGRLTGLIDDLLDVSRIQVGKLTYRFDDNIDLRDIARAAIDGLADQFKIANCPIYFAEDELSREKVIVQCDHFRIEQIVINLLTNALKYGAGKPVEVSVRLEGHTGVIQVKDRGLGIPEEKHSVIFGRFERAVDESSISGLGLGLYISQQIALAHKGSIDVKSTVGEGSTFSVRLPIVRA